MRFHLLIVGVNGDLFRSSSVPKSSSLFFTFCSMRFYFSGTLLKSLIHVELSFVQGVK